MAGNSSQRGSFRLLFAIDELVNIAEQASVHTFGWPIGVVLRNRNEFRPRPINDGIVADIETDHSYDYWMLRTNGDFYTLTGLFEDYRAEGALFFDTRIVQTTEAILHAINIYKAFGVEAIEPLSSPSVMEDCAVEG